jgi:hypothetical protein
MVFEGFGVDHIHAKLFPMHGTKQVHENWKAVNSNVDKYLSSTKAIFHHMIFSEQMMKSWLCLLSRFELLNNKLNDWY